MKNSSIRKVNPDLRGPTENSSCFLAAAITGLAFLLIAPPAASREIAWLYALDADAKKVKELAGGGQSTNHTVGTRKVQIVKFGEHQVYLVKMQSGALASAVSAEALLGRFQIDIVISTGPVGGLSDELVVGETCLVEELVAWQAGAHLPSGFVTGIQGQWKVDSQRTFDRLIRTKKDRLRSIRVASGEAFIASSEFREELRRRTDCDAVEMNLSGVMEAQTNHNLPGIHLRIVSDRADDEASDDFQKWVAAYDGALAQVAMDWISQIEEDPSSARAYENLRTLIE